MYSKDFPLYLVRLSLCCIHSDLCQRTQTKERVVGRNLEAFLPLV